jgi:hypothetical protein
MIRLVTVSFQQLAKRCLSRRMMTILILLLSPPAVRDVFPDEPIRCVVIDVYYRSGDANHPEFLEKLEKFKTARGGIILTLRDVTTEERNRERLDTILKHFRIVPPNGPVLYGCNRVLHKATPEATWQSQLEEMLQLEVFVRSGCSRCAAAKQWLPTFMKEYPGLKIVQRDIAVDGAQAARLSKLVEKHQTAAASVPVFHLCDRLVVGFHQAESSGGQLRNLLKPWTKECPQEKEAGAPPKEKVKRIRSSSALPRPVSMGVTVTGILASNSLIVATLVPNEQAVIDPSEDADDGKGAGDSEKPSDELALPLPGDDLMIGDGSDSAPPGTGDSTGPEESTDDQMDIPVFGRLSARKLGLPVFTIAVGLVDGFNPCAMWVLLFLLSILVNLKDRRRIFAIAGTFVVVSGLAYFAFMAAWLNVFMLIGYLRPIQVVLALMAVLIGRSKRSRFMTLFQAANEVALTNFCLRVRHWHKLPRWLEVASSNRTRDRLDVPVHLTSPVLRSRPSKKSRIQPTSAIPCSCPAGSRRSHWSTLRRFVKTPNWEVPTFALSTRRPPTSTVISGAVSVSR